MFSLDSLIENTERAITGGSNGSANGAPRIISANHDLGSINWVNGVTDPGEMIACGYLQQLRRLEGESDEAYKGRLLVELGKLPREERERITNTLIEAAKKRASYDTSTGRVALMVAGKAAWSELGVLIDKACNGEQARQFSSTDFRVEKIQEQVIDPLGSVRDVPGRFALCRADTGAVLGSVGSDYKVFQNHESTEMLDAIIGEFGAKYHTAGSIFGGAQVWYQVELPHQSFEVVAGDENIALAMLTNPHDGSGRAWVFPTYHRAVCANTHRTACNDKDKGIGIIHKGDMKAHIESARRALGLAVHNLEDYRDNAAVLVRTAVSPVQASQYFANVLDAVVDITDAQMKRGAAALANDQILEGIITGQEAREAAERKFERAIRDRSTLLDDIVSRWESERCNVGGTRHTAWGVLQAANEAAEHGKRREGGDKEGRASRRFVDNLNGERDEMKQVAYVQALALAS